MFILWYFLRCHRENGNFRRGHQIYIFEEGFNKSIEYIRASYTQKSQVNWISNYVSQRIDNFDSRFLYAWYHFFSNGSKSRAFDNANKSNHDYDSEDNTIRSMSYFKELSKKQIEDLYKMYFFDFKLFDYDITRYFEIHENWIFDWNL